METHINSFFHVRNDKKTKDSLYPIYLRVTIDWERFEYSTQRYIALDKWSQDLGRVKGKTDEAKNINEYLDVLVHKVFVYQIELTLEGKPVTIGAFRNK